MWVPVRVFSARSPRRWVVYLQPSLLSPLILAKAWARNGSSMHTVAAQAPTCLLSSFHPFLFLTLPACLSPSLCPCHPSPTPTHLPHHRINQNHTPPHTPLLPFHTPQPDEQKALLHYYFGAAGGDVLSQMALAYRHMHGAGVPKSCWSAATYYQAVAETVLEGVLEDGGVAQVRVMGEGWQGHVVGVCGWLCVCMGWVGGRVWHLSCRKWGMVRWLSSLSFATQCPPCFPNPLLLE